MARFVPHEGVDLPETALEDDLDGRSRPCWSWASLRFHVIKRGERIGVRVRDASAPALAQLRRPGALPD